MTDDGTEHLSASWAHAPVHKLEESGAYMVTAGTYRKIHHLSSAPRLELFQGQFFSLSERFRWELQAWAIMANHYHFVAVPAGDPHSLRPFLAELHKSTASELNRMDATTGRRVWFQFRDTHLTYPASYLARLKYVHNNPAHHGIVRDASQYRWCSRTWFDQRATGAFRRTVESFRTDRLRVDDDF